MLKKLRTWWRGTIVLTMALIFGVPALASRIVSSQRVQDKVREFAKIVLKSELGMEAHFSEVSVQWFPPAITTHNIALNHPKHGQFAKAQRLTVTPSLLEIFRGQTRIDLVELENSSIRLLLRGGKILNLPIAKQQGSDEASMPFNDIVISNSNLYIDAGEKGTAQLKGIDVDAEAVTSKTAELRLISTSGHITHSMGKEQIKKIEIRARISPEMITLHRGILQTPEAWLSARSLKVPLPWKNTLAGQIDADIDISHIHGLPLGLSLPPLFGRVAISAKIELENGIPSATGKVRLSDFKIDRYGFGSKVSTSFSANQKQIRFENGAVDIIGDGGNVYFEGTLGLTRHLPLKTTAKIRQVQFARIMEQLGVTPNSLVSWKTNGLLKLEGNCSPLELEGYAETDAHNFLVSKNAWHSPTPERIIGYKQIKSRGKVSVKADGWRFHNYELFTENTKVQADALLGFDNVLRVKANVEQIELEEASPLLTFPIEGHGKIKLRVDGTFSDPKVNWDFNLLDTRMDVFPIGDIQSGQSGYLDHGSQVAVFPIVHGSTEQSKFTLNNFLLDFRDSRIAVSANVDATKIQLQELLPSFIQSEGLSPEDYQGVLKGKTTLRYTHGYPGDSPRGTLQAEGNVQLESLKIHGTKFETGEFSGKWVWRDFEQGYLSNELSIDQLVLRKGLGTLNVSGNLAPQGSLDFVVIADQLDIPATELIHQRLPKLGGSYSLLARLQGSIDAPDVGVEVNTAAITWKGHPLGDGQIYFRHLSAANPWLEKNEAKQRCPISRQQLLNATWSTTTSSKKKLTSGTLVCGDLLDGQITADLVIGRSRSLPTRGKIDLDSLKLDAFLPKTEPQSLKGVINGHLSLQNGGLANPKDFAARIHIAHLNILQSEELEFQNSGPITARFEDQRFIIEHAAMKGPGSFLRVSGEGSQKKLALRVDGEIALKPLANLSDLIEEADGKIRIEKLTLTGSPKQPALSGRAKLAGGKLLLTALDFPLNSMQGAIEFNERAIIFRDVRANAAGGKIAVSGQTNLNSGKVEGVDLKIRANGIRYQLDEGVETSIGTQDLRLSWKKEELTPLLSGTLRVNRFNYTKPIRLGQTLREISQTRPQQITRYDPKADRVRLDLAIKETNPIVVDNNLMRASLRSDKDRPLKIVGTDQRFGVLGGLVVTRGRLNFRNNDFDIRSGVIEFEDKNSIQPRFDLQAVTEIRRTVDLSEPRWRVFLHAYGDSNSFVLKTTSEPELPSEDILLLLTVGMTRAEAEQLQAGELTQSAALEALTTVTGVDREVKKVIEIDDFAVTSGYSPRTNRTTPQVTIGKRITDNVRLRATTGLSESREYKTQLEWQTSKRTSVQAVYDNFSTTGTNLGNVGIDVRWRLEFE